MVIILYDYLIIYSDEVYKNSIKAIDFKQFMTRTLGFEESTKLRFYKEICGEMIRLTGIQANSNGSYAFETLDGVEDINLIEIDVPNRIDHEIENEVLKIANIIAKKYAWIVDLRDE